MAKDGILGVGVATMDIYVNEGRMYPGGNEFNVACNAKFIGSRAGFLGVFGNDAYGPILEDTLKQCEVDVSYCHHENGTSGYSLVELKEDGDRVFLDWNKQGVTDLYPVQFLGDELEYVKSFEVVSVGRCSTVTLEKIKWLRENDMDICYDFHAIYSDEKIRSFCPYITYAFFSSSHLSMEEIRHTLKLAVDSGSKIAIGTRGEDSIIAYDGTWYEQTTFPVKKVVDALGAGDSFIAAFLSSYLEHKDREESERVQKGLKDAAKYASGVISKEGSIGVGFDRI